MRSSPAPGIPGLLREELSGAHLAENCRRPPNNRPQEATAAMSAVPDVTPWSAHHHSPVGPLRRSKPAKSAPSGLGSVLVNGNGRTLYILASEKGGKVTCTAHQSLEVGDGGALGGQQGPPCRTLRIEAHDVHAWLIAADRGTPRNDTVEFQVRDPNELCDRGRHTASPSRPDSEPLYRSCSNRIRRWCQWPVERVHDRSLIWVPAEGAPIDVLAVISNTC